MNSEIPHQVVFLDESWVFATGSESKICHGGTSQSTKMRGLTTSSGHIIVHAGTLNDFFLGRV
jgi:hypothetical protein